MTSAVDKGWGISPKSGLYYKSNPNNYNPTRAKEYSRNYRALCRVARREAGMPFRRPGGKKWSAERRAASREFWANYRASRRM